MKSFRKVLSKLEKCLSNCDQVVQLTDFYPGFYRDVFLQMDGKLSIFKSIAAAIGVFSRCLKSKSGYFLGFSKKKNSMSVPTTSIH